MLPSPVGASTIQVFRVCWLVYNCKPTSWLTRQSATSQTVQSPTVTPPVTIPLSATGQAHAAHPRIYVWTTIFVLHKAARKCSIEAAARIQAG